MLNEAEKDGGIITRLIMILQWNGICIMDIFDKKIERAWLAMKLLINS